MKIKDIVLENKVHNANIACLFKFSLIILPHHKYNENKKIIEIEIEMPDQPV